jgi:hypothetical protein
MEGKTLGSYKVLERLGAGGQGHVYRALDTTLDRAPSRFCTTSFSPIQRG